METKIFAAKSILYDNFELFIGEEPPVKNNVNQCFEPNNCRCIGTLEEDEVANNPVLSDFLEGLTFDNSPREIMILKH